MDQTRIDIEYTCRADWENGDDMVKPESYNSCLRIFFDYYYTTKTFCRLKYIPIRHPLAE